jgi:hypothetical protein
VPETAKLTPSAETELTGPTCGSPVKVIVAHSGPLATVFSELGVSEGAVPTPSAQAARSVAAATEARRASGAVRIEGGCPS